MWPFKKKTQQNYELNSLEDLSDLMAKFDTRLLEFYPLYIESNGTISNSDIEQEIKVAMEDWNLAYEKAKFVYDNSTTLKKEVGRLIDLML